MKKPPFIIVDGSSYLFRAYHALPPLTTRDGQPTGAIYGVLNMLRRLISNYNPTNMVVIFDTKEPNFRHEIFPEYKANRTIMPDDLSAQIQPLYDSIEAMGLPLLYMPGFEADDIIGSLAVMGEKNGLKTVISTGDKDMAQLVNENITLVNTMSDTTMDINGVIEKFGVTPKQIIDFLALTGDTVDNIPGVHKVGPKTAVKWLEKYKNLENIMENHSEIKGKVGEYLKDALNDLPLYKKLTTIKTDLPLKITLEELKIKKENKERLKELFNRLEFKQWIKNLDESKEEIHKEADYKLINDEKSFETLLSELRKTDKFAFDTETDSLNALTANLVGISFSTKPYSGYYIPVGHLEGKQLDRNFVIEKITKILADKSKTIIGHNLKFDILVLEKYKVKVKNNIFDTMLASYINNSLGKQDLDSVAQFYLKAKTITYDEVTKIGKKQINFNEVDIDTATTYAAEDSDIALRLYNYFFDIFEERTELKKVLYEIEIPLLMVLYRMESKGVLIDKNLLKEQSKEIEKELEGIKKETFDIAKEEFNLNSPKQLQEILFEKLKLPVIEKTPKGAPSTSESALHELSKYPIASLILNYRSLSKLKSTYTDKLPEEINPNTNRIHTSFQQAVTATGRLSSSNPNLQNIPIRTKRGKDIRAAFIPSKDYKILSVDYSQIELRIMAHLSKDKTLIDAFNQGLDIHSKTASEIFSIELSEVTSEQRSYAKAINFGLMYGMSSYGLSKQINISIEDADDYIKKYFENFPEVYAFIEKTKEIAKSQGYVETLFGRRLYLPNIQSKNFALRQASQRAAINAPMQGTNADIIKKAMIEIDEWIHKNNLKINMIIQVHDELVFEVHNDEMQHIETIKQKMENITKLDVPLIVEYGVAENWKDAH